MSRPVDKAFHEEVERFIFAYVREHNRLPSYKVVEASMKCGRGTTERAIAKVREIIIRAWVAFGPE